MSIILFIYNAIIHRNSVPYLVKNNSFSVFIANDTLAKDKECMKQNVNLFKFIAEKTYRKKSFQIVEWFESLNRKLF